MKCPACGCINRAARRFCAECGAPLALRCSQCSAENQPGEKLCGECGAEIKGLGVTGLAARGNSEPLTPNPVTPNPLSYTPKHLADKILQSKSALEGERKQVTVLFADVKGSMELAEQLDPEQWHTILDRFFAILTDGVHRFEGTVNQYTGDGIMALFGAPIAHEDHAQRACYAALHLRDALKGYADELRRTHGREPRRRASVSTPARWSSAGSATTCAWTTRRRVTPWGWRNAWNRAPPPTARI